LPLQVPVAGQVLAVTQTEPSLLQVLGGHTG
jgi:hypothetical protein